MGTHRSHHHHHHHDQLSSNIQHWLLDENIVIQKRTKKNLEKIINEKKNLKKSERKRLPWEHEWMENSSSSSSCYLDISNGKIKDGTQTHNTQFHVNLFFLFHFIFIFYFWSKYTHKKMYLLFHFNERINKWNQIIMNIYMILSLHKYKHNTIHVIKKDLLHFQFDTYIFKFKFKFFFLPRQKTDSNQ